MPNWNTGPAPETRVSRPHPSAPRRMREKITVLQGGRAIAALGVLLLHAAILIERHGQARPPGWTFLDWGELGVDFFFVLSGFDNPACPRKRSPRAGGRLVICMAKNHSNLRAIPAAGLGNHCFYIAFPSLGAEKIWSLFTSLTLIAAEWPPAPALSVAWTLIHEVMFYAIFLLSYCTPRS